MQTDDLIRGLLTWLEGRSLELPKNNEHRWEKLRSLLQEDNRHSVEVLRETAQALHVFGCLESLEDRGDTFVCGGLTKVGKVRLETHNDKPIPHRVVLILALNSFFVTAVARLLQLMD